MAELGVLQPIFNVCAREIGYEERGRLWVPWRMQTAADKQLMVLVETISEAIRVRRQQESGGRGKSKEGSEGGITGSKG